MKKIVSTALLTAIVFNLAAACLFFEAAAAGTANIYLDFENYNGGALAQFQPVNEYKDYINVGTDPDGVRGKNVKLTARTNADGPYSNWAGAGFAGYPDNNVFGYALYATEATNMLVNMKVKTTSGSDAWLPPLIAISNGTIRFCNKNSFPFDTSGAWSDVRAALDFDNHKALLYVNGTKLAEEDINSSFAYTNYSNVNFLKASREGVSYLDDFVEYSSKTANITAAADDGEALGNTIVSCSIPYIDITFGVEAQEGGGPNAEIRKKNGDAVASHAEYTYRRNYMTSYPTGARIYLDELLESDSEYELTVSEKDLLGDSFEKTIGFSSESTTPRLFIDYSNTVQNQDVTSLPAGTKVSFNFSTYKIPSDDTLECLINGVKKGEVGAGESSFSVYLEAFDRNRRAVGFGNA